MKTHGFTLFEILLVLALIGILSQFAVSNYQSLTASTKRRDAEIALAMLADRLEDYAVRNGGYRGVTLIKLKIQPKIAGGAYTLRIDEADTSSFLISAHPAGRQTHLDEQCGTLSLNALGDKRISGNGSIAGCWS